MELLKGGMFRPLPTVRFRPIADIRLCCEARRMWKRKQPPTLQPEAGELAEAARNPGGWVYRIAGAYSPHDRVPPEAIVGAWKVGDDGQIVGDFMPNPNFKGGNG